MDCPRVGVNEGWLSRCLTAEEVEVTAEEIAGTTAEEIAGTTAEEIAGTTAEIIHA